MIIIPDILESFINGFDLTSSILSSSDDGTNTTIFVDNVYHCRPFLIVDVDSVNYTVVSVDYSVKSIVLSGVIVAPLFVLTVSNPFFWHGTPLMTNSHISQLQDSSKIPMIYLYEIYRETLNDSLSSVASSVDLRLFFLDVANYQDWDTDLHYTNVIQPQRNLIDYFINQIKENVTDFIEPNSYEIINHVNFGIYRDFEGHIKKIFNDNLSGIELKFTLEIKNKNNC